ncbi:Uncharacterised protein [Pseudomonas aeruginosa]|nr:Uncharacterised protein [Pseudomonas aeruginosa]
MIDWEFLVPVAMGWALHHWWTVMTALAAVGGRHEGRAAPPAGSARHER